MASDQSFADYVRDQARGAGDVTTRRMFGEYALYVDGKVVALLCDNQCFVRPTDAGRAFLGTYNEGHPFPGSKAHLLIAEELDDAERVAELLRITAREMPLPKKKSAKKPAKKPAKTAAKKPVKGTTRPRGKGA